MTTIDASTRNGPNDDGRDTTKDAKHESLMDTVSEPDPTSDPAEEIEENGELFEGNHA